VIWILFVFWILEFTSVKIAYVHTRGTNCVRIFIEIM